MTESAKSNLPKLGTCVKKQDRTILSQDEECQRICGNRIGQICTDGCMKSYQKTDFGEQDFRIGFQLIRNVKNRNHTFDVVILNDGERLTTLLFEKERFIIEQMQYLERFNLSKSETLIIEKYLRGLSSRQICNELFISRATLRTHLNNIYKKLPEGLKTEILSGHLGKC